VRAVVHRVARGRVTVGERVTGEVARGLLVYLGVGAGDDEAAQFEAGVALAAGGNVRASVFAGVGKSEAEIELALKNDIFSFHVESEPELARINHVAGKLGVKAPIAIRVNPDVDAHTHAKITTGKSDNKFGIPLKVAGAAYEAAAPTLTSDRVCAPCAAACPPLPICPAA
jgi:diaminopimelate decarboxylase